MKSSMNSEYNWNVSNQFSPISIASVLSIPPVIIPSVSKLFNLKS